MNELFQQLLQRQMAQPSEMPTVLPNPPKHVPPQVQRWSNAQAIQEAYRNDWTPNPVLLKAQMSK